MCQTPSSQMHFLMEPFQCPWSSVTCCSFYHSQHGAVPAGQSQVHTKTLTGNPRSLSSSSTLPIDSLMNQPSWWHELTSSSCSEVDVNQNSDVKKTTTTKQWCSFVGSNHKSATHFSRLTPNANEQSPVICTVDTWLLCWAGWHIINIPKTCLY